MKLGRYLSDCILLYMPSGQRVLYLMDEIFFNLEEKNNQKTAIWRMILTQRRITHIMLTAWLYKLNMLNYPLFVHIG